MPGIVTKYRRKKRYYRRLPLYRTRTNYMGIVYKQINIQLVCYKKNNEGGSAGTGYTLAPPALTNDGQNYVLFTALRDNGEYGKFKAIYNYVKMIGITIHTVPAYRNIAGSDNASAFKGYVNLYYAENNTDQVEQLNPLALNPFVTQKVYIRRQLREWIDSDITVAQASATENFGYIVVKDNDKTVTQNYCPWWNLYIKIYLAFKGSRA